MKYFWFFAVFCSVTLGAFAQNKNKQVKLRWNNNGLSVRGDFEIIGNNSISISKLADDEEKEYPRTIPPTLRDYPPTKGNFYETFGYIDVDNDPNTFQSSSATLVVNSNAPECLRVKWAGLYWSAFRSRYPDQYQERSILFKTPFNENYISITADRNEYFWRRGDYSSYSCFQDVTHLLQGKSPVGEYTVANINSATGVSYNSISAGWALVIVYEDTDESRLDKKITIYDGNVLIDRDTEQRKDIPVTGFQTIPHGDVKAKIGLVAWEGDKVPRGDSFLINGVKIGTGDETEEFPDRELINHKNNFFDSNITFNHQYNRNRNPFSRSTFGWDIDVFDLENPNNSILSNNAINVDLTLLSVQDVYALLTTAFSVETISPKIELEKTLKGIDPTTGQEVDFQMRPVGFGQQLIYEMNFKNTGNDDAVNAQLIDLLPANVDLNNIAPLPQGVTLHSQEDVIVNGAVRKKITLNIDNELLKKGGVTTNIRINVDVVKNSCDLRDACSNEIKNIASIEYQSASDVRFGIEKKYEAQSFNGRDKCSKLPEPTNFLINTDECPQQNLRALLCNNQARLVAGEGFKTYIWRKQGDPTILSLNREYIANEVGTYEVTKTSYPAQAHCSNRLTEVFEVFTQETTNPLEAIATQTMNFSGHQYSFFPLHQNTALEKIDLTNIGAAQIKWYKYTGQISGTQTGIPKTEANKNKWGLVHNKKEFLFSREDFQNDLYAVEIEYLGGETCNQTFYFHILYQLENPEYQIITTDSYCNPNKAKIEFQLNDNDMLNRYDIRYAIKKQNEQWQEQATPIFTNISTGNYTTKVIFKQKNATDWHDYSEPSSYHLNEINTPIQAFVGVSRLACIDDANNSIDAQIRVTNVTGGNAVNHQYEYKFGTNNWTTSNTGNLPPGTHTIQVRSVAQPDCTFETSLEVPAPLTTPIFTQTLNYDCHGKGIVVFTPENTTDYEFSYTQTGNPDNWNSDPSFTFTDLPVGRHTLKVNYRPKNFGTPSLLIEENFGQGETTTSSEVPNTYRFEDQEGRNPAINDGEYSITKRIEHLHIGWVSPQDHSRLPDGRFLAINIGEVAGTGGVIYKKQVNDILPNQPIHFQLFAFNLIDNRQNASDPELTIELVSANNQVIDQIERVRIPKNRNNNDWVEISSGSDNTLDPKGHTSLFVQIRTLNTARNGNDLALDDIRVYQQPEFCINTLAVPIVVEPNKSLGVNVSQHIQQLKCTNDTNATATFTLNNYNEVNPIDYRLLKNGTEIQPYQQTQQKEISFTDLGHGNYTFEARATGWGDCMVSYDFQIAQPQALEILMPQTTHFMPCGATETTLNLHQLITAQGGKAPYMYAVFNKATNQEIDVQTNGDILLNEVGTYYVFVRDANNCHTTTDFEIQHRPAPDIQPISLQSVSCFGASDGQVSFRITQATNNAPYRYKIIREKDKATLINDQIDLETPTDVTNLEAGDYSIEVTDANHCVNVHRFVIEPKNNLEVIHLETRLRCLNNATITDVYVTFRDVQPTGVQYSIEQEVGNPLRDFSHPDPQNPNTLIIENIQLLDGTYTINIHYQNCQKQVGIPLQIRNPEVLTLINRSEATELNEIKIEVQGGKAPYRVIYSSPSLGEREAQLNAQNRASYIFKNYDSGYTSPEGKQFKRLTIWVEDALGCVKQMVIDKEFFDIEIPNFFTPNNDGDNDQWEVKNALGYKLLSVDIFDRYGRLLKTLAVGEKWDGKYFQKELPSGDYWYIIRLNDNYDQREFKGHFTLYR